MTMARGMNMNYVTLFLETLNENNMLGEPARVHNADQSRLQWNNRPKRTVCMKGKKGLMSVAAKQRRGCNYSRMPI
jgi:hypothetical protein